MKKTYVIVGICVTVLLVGLVAYVLVKPILPLVAFADSVAMMEESLKPENRRKAFDSPEKIEGATGIRLPEFDVMEYREGEVIGIEGDFTDTLFIRFRTDIPGYTFDSFERKADSLRRIPIIDEFSHLENVHIEGDNYRYQNMKVNNRNEEIEIHIRKGERDGEIIYGKW